jgi:hypothetical protein
MMDSRSSMTLAFAVTGMGGLAESGSGEDERCCAREHQNLFHHAASPKASEMNGC